jgi:UDP-glucose 4-epimerase
VAQRALFNDKKVLITGGIGFIGSNLARQLLELGANVTVVDSLIPEYGGNLMNIRDIADQITVNISDVRDQHSMNYLVRDHDYLFNLAGQTSHMDSMQNPYTDLDINCRAQLSILEACKQNNPNIKVVFASTRQIYGKPDYLPVDERHPIRPLDVNGINKASGEWYHILYNNVYGIRACVLRLTNTYGPRMRIKDARQTFLGIWVRLLLENREFEVWGGQQLRDFNFVDDCVSALILAAGSESVNGQAYNLGDLNTISLKALADLLVEINGAGGYVEREFPQDRKKIDIGDYYSDFRGFKQVTGWSPTIDLPEGLNRTLDYFRINMKHYI